jgi:hypothetical protein
MPQETLSKSLVLIFEAYKKCVSLIGTPLFSAFVTGNANKLREVKEILASSGVPLIVQSRSIDCELSLLAARSGN